MIYFTADLHLGHKNIIRFCDRPFQSVMEMDETIIDNWNSKISGDDTVYVDGDFAYNSTMEYSSELNGLICLIPGSHDKFKSSDYLIDNVHIIRDHIYQIPDSGLKDEYGNDRLIVLCHYSMRSWNKSHYASYHLFGHHHGRLSPYGLSFDVGVDTNNFFPYSLDDIEKKMKTLKPIIDYRKGEK
jgi:calcineurin-like phosphoesterase family protein